MKTKNLRLLADGVVKLALGTVGATSDVLRVAGAVVYEAGTLVTAGTRKLADEAERKLLKPDAVVSQYKWYVRDEHDTGHQLLMVLDGRSKIDLVGEFEKTKTGEIIAKVFNKAKDEPGMYAPAGPMTAQPHEAF